MTEVYTRKIFSAADITLNINQIIVIVLFLRRKMRWSFYGLSEKSKNHPPGFNSRYVILVSGAYTEFQITVHTFVWLLQMGHICPSER